MKLQYSLQARTTWVIGGAGYLCASIVEKLLEQGCHVICADLEDHVDKLADRLGDPDGLIPVTLDAREEIDIHRFAANQAAETGIPDGLVVLTYGASGKQLKELTAEDFDQASQLGITSTFLLARAAGDLMVNAGKGSIVLFSSMYGLVSPDPRIYEPPMQVNPIEYGVGKAGIIQMTRYLAVHWAGSGLRVNCISPGPFPNENVQKQHPGFIDRLAHKVPLGRIGLPEEIAGPVLFLLSDASSYVTGHNLVVDGGWTVY